MEKGNELSRDEWNKRFVTHLMKISEASRDICEYSARESDAYFDDDYVPEDAADEEYSYWDS